MNGRKLELISRDTQSDPTKAVNGATELTRREKVHVIWGPLNSGEALAATPLIARDNVPQLHPVLGRWLTDPKRWPLAFRNVPPISRWAAPRTTMWWNPEGQEGCGDRRHHRIWHGIGQRLCADGQGQGRLRGDHQEQLDVKPEMLRMQAGGAQAIMPWSVNAGFLSRLINARAR